MEFCVAAPSKRREEKLKTVQEREVLMIQATQVAIEEEAKKRLAALQAQEEAERAREEEAARIEAEREEAAKLEADGIMAEEDVVRADAMRKQQAVDQRLAAEQAERAKIDAEKEVAMMKAGEEAKKTEVTEKASIISDPRVDKF